MDPPDELNFLSPEYGAAPPPSQLPHPSHGSFYHPQSTSPHPPPPSSSSPHQSQGGEGFGRGAMDSPSSYYQKEAPTYGYPLLPSSSSHLSAPAFSSPPYSHPASPSYGDEMDSGGFLGGFYPGDAEMGLGGAQPLSSSSASLLLNTSTPTPVSLFDSSPLPPTQRRLRPLPLSLVLPAPSWLLLLSPFLPPFLPAFLLRLLVRASAEEGVGSLLASSARCAAVAAVGVAAVPPAAAAARPLSSPRLLLASLRPLTRPATRRSTAPPPASTPPPTLSRSRCRSRRRAPSSLPSFHSPPSTTPQSDHHPMFSSPGYSPPLQSLYGSQSQYPPPSALPSGHPHASADYFDVAASSASSYPYHLTPAGRLRPLAVPPCSSSLHRLPCARLPRTVPRTAVAVALRRPPPRSTTGEGEAGRVEAAWAPSHSPSSMEYRGLTAQQQLTLSLSFSQQQAPSSYSASNPPSSASQPLRGSLSPSSPSRGPGHLHPHVQRHLQQQQQLQMQQQQMHSKGGGGPSEFSSLSSPYSPLSSHSVSPLAVLSGGGHHSHSASYPSIASLPSSRPLNVNAGLGVGGVKMEPGVQSQAGLSSNAAGRGFLASIHQPTTPPGLHSAVSAPSASLLRPAVLLSVAVQHGQRGGGGEEGRR